MFYKRAYLQNPSRCHAYLFQAHIVVPLLSFCLKKVRDSVMGFEDMFVYKTCLFFLGSQVRGGGGGLISGTSTKGFSSVTFRVVLQENTQIL